MKQIQHILLLSFLVFGLTACSQGQFSQLNISPKPSLNTIKTDDKSFSLKSQDLRKNQFIVLLDDGKMPKTVNAVTPTEKTLQSTISQQFSSQGFKITPNNPNVVKVELVEALSKVDNSLFSHQVDSKVKVQIVADNGKSQFVKSYSGNALDKGISTASAKKLEKVLNNLFEAVLTDISNDNELNYFIRDNF